MDLWLEILIGLVAATYLIDWGSELWSIWRM